MKLHLHKYKIDTELSNGHKHRISGYSGGMVGIRMLHFHFFYGVSSYTDHTHYYSGITGMPIKTEHGHIHKIEGLLEINDLHSHSFKGYTFEETGYVPRNLLREALI